MSVWRKGSARLPGLGRLAAALVLVLGMVCLLPACGTSDGLDEKAESFDYSHIRTDPDVVALLPKDIKDSGELTIGTNAIYAPAEYTGEDTKTIMGYEIDIARGLGKVMGLRVRPIESNFDNIIPAMGSKFDLGMSPSPSRRKGRKASTSSSITGLGSASSSPGAIPANSPSGTCAGPRPPSRPGPPRKKASWPWPGPARPRARPP